VTDISGSDAEDAKLYAAWLAGPGARPTVAEGKRWLEATKEGRLPRRQMTRDGLAIRRLSRDDD